MSEKKNDEVRSGLDTMESKSDTSMNPVPSAKAPDTENSGAKKLDQPNKVIGRMRHGMLIRGKYFAKGQKVQVIVEDIYYRLIYHGRFYGYLTEDDVGPNISHPIKSFALGRPRHR